MDANPVDYGYGLYKEASAVARRRDIGTAEKKAAFIAALREHYAVYVAARAAGVGRSTVYRWREADHEFAKAWDDAQEDAVDLLEESMYSRAMKGDTTAAIFLLKGMRPERYKERTAHEHTGRDGGPIRVEDARERLAGRIASIASRSGAEADPGES